jgi:hypothetical protein
MIKWAVRTKEAENLKEERHSDLGIKVWSCNLKCDRKWGFELNLKAVAQCLHIALTAVATFTLAGHGVKGKVLPRTGHEGPEGEYRYSSTLSLTSALDVGGWSTPRPGRFTPGKETRYPLYRRPVWTGAENLASTGIRSLNRSARSESLYRPTEDDEFLIETCSV